NFETWTWAGTSQLRRCSAFLRYLLNIPEVNRDVISPWLRRLPSPSRSRLEVGWLWGDKTASRRRAFRALTKGLGDIRTLRIVSPYFDDGSAALLESLLQETAIATNGETKVEIWTDGSGSVSGRSDYQHLIKLITARRRFLEVKTVIRQGTDGLRGI